MNEVALRLARPADANSIAKLIFDSFEALSANYGQASDFESPPADQTRQRLDKLPQCNDFCVVAETEKLLVGVNFIDCHGDIGAIGVLAVLPSFQGQGIGRRLMEAVIEHGKHVGYTSQRLLQAAYNARSMGLYLSMKMVVREHLLNFNGTVNGKSNPDISIEQGTDNDVEACSTFCQNFYRTGRSREIEEAAAGGNLFIARESRSITGLTTGIGFAGFSVASTNDILKSLIVNEKIIEPPGVLVPAKNHSLVQWCLDSGLKTHQTMNLMTLGEYEEPVGSWLPSINF